MEHKYRVSFRVGDASLDLESTDLSWLESREKDYVAKFLEKGISFIESTASNERLKSGFVPKNLTVNEFYKNFVTANKIRTRPDIAVFFVYYLERILRKETIRSADVMQCFVDVSYPGFRKLNIHEILIQAKRKALLNCVNNFWSLTVVGEDFVLNNILSEVQ